MSTDASSTPPSGSAYPPLPHSNSNVQPNSPRTVPTFSKGQQFPSLATFKDHVRNTAFQQHWEPSVANSNRSKVQIKCRSSDDCPFKIWCRIDPKTQVATVSNVDNTHSCLGAPLADRNQGSRLQFLETEIPRLLDLRNGRVSGQQVVDAIKTTHGFEISIRQAQRALRSLRMADTGRNYTSLDGADDSALPGDSLDQGMSNVDDELGDVDNEMGQQQQQQPPHVQQHAHQYPPPPMAPQVLHHHQPPQSAAHVQAQADQQPHAHSMPPQYQHQSRGFTLQTPAGLTVTGPPHELIRFLQTTMER